MHFHDQPHKNTHILIQFSSMGDLLHCSIHVWQKNIRQLVLQNMITSTNISSWPEESFFFVRDQLVKLFWRYVAAEGLKQIAHLDTFLYHCAARSHLLCYSTTNDSHPCIFIQFYIKKVTLNLCNKSSSSSLSYHYKEQDAHSKLSIWY